LALIPLPFGQNGIATVLWSLRRWLLLATQPSNDWRMERAKRRDECALSPRRWAEIGPRNGKHEERKRKKLSGRRVKLDLFCGCKENFSKIPFFFGKFYVLLQSETLRG